MRLLLPVIAIVVCFGFAPAPITAAEPQLIATDVVSAVPVNAGSQVLCFTSEQELQILDLPLGRPQPWHLQWDPADAGLRYPSGDYFPNIAACPSGETVVIARYVELEREPDDEFPYGFYAIILCKPDGSAARIAALADVTDGGPLLQFSMDGRYLTGPWFFDCEPSAAGYHAWFAELEQMDVSAGEMAEQLNAYDLQEQRLVHLPGLIDSLWGVDKSPYSDWYFLDDPDQPLRYFGELYGAHGSDYIRASLPIDDPGYLFRSDWIGPQLTLVWSEHGQWCISPHGAHWPAPAGQWISYCLLSDGRSIFSADGGGSIELGRIDCLNGTVDGRRAMPELEHFAVAFESNGWPQRVDTWIPMSDASAVLINTPGIDGGKLFYFALD
jgi:hypothetical protein